MGSGWPFRDGYICGVSVAYRAEDGMRGTIFRCVIPTATISTPRRSIGGCATMFAADVRIVTQNGLYD